MFTRRAIRSMREIRGKRNAARMLKEGGIEPTSANVRKALRDRRWAEKLRRRGRLARLPLSAILRAPPTPEAFRDESVGGEKPTIH